MGRPVLPVFWEVASPALAKLQAASTQQAVYCSVGCTLCLSDKPLPGSQGEQDEMRCCTLTLHPTSVAALRLREVGN